MYAEVARQVTKSVSFLAHSVDMSTFCKIYAEKLF